MNETIFDKITEVYHTINSWHWHPALGSEPNGFSSMQIDEKQRLCCSILMKLKYLLNNPSDMLISWSWWDKHLHRSFGDWLQFQLEQIPETINQPKNGKIVNRVKQWINKMLK